MKKIQKAIRTVFGRTRTEGDEGIHEVGHRQFVGGKWQEIGTLQFEYLVQQGLKPADCFLDVACGSLRGGVHFISYLEIGNYLGIDKESKLIELGIEKELGNETFDEKLPEFVVSGQFDFASFTKIPQFSLAQSLFSHLSSKDICLCLDKLGKFVKPGHIFFASFYEGSSSVNPDYSHSHSGFLYSRAEMVEFGDPHGWIATYIGDWNHPRNQMMMKYESC